MIGRELVIDAAIVIEIALLHRDKRDEVVEIAPDRNTFAGFHDEVLGILAMNGTVLTMNVVLRAEIGRLRVEKLGVLGMNGTVLGMNVVLRAEIGRLRVEKLGVLAMIARERDDQGTDHAVKRTVLVTIRGFVATQAADRDVKRARRAERVDLQAYEGREIGA